MKHDITIAKIRNILDMAEECGEWRELVQKNSSLLPAGNAGTSLLILLEEFFRQCRERQQGGDAL